MSTKINPDFEPLLDLNEAATLGFGANSTLRQYIRQGKLKAYKVGGKTKIRVSDLEAMAVPHPSAPAESVEEWAQRMAATAPPMTDEQAQKIVAILRGGASG